jgi:hypothetical protein
MTFNITFISNIIINFSSTNNHIKPPINPKDLDNEKVYMVITLISFSSIIFLSIFLLTFLKNRFFSNQEVEKVLEFEEVEIE